MMGQEGILLSLAQGPEGSQWASSRIGWHESSEACSWEGIECEHGYVTHILLAYSGLSGTLPQELGSLFSLETISLERNALTGSIPTSIATLPNLVSLDLSFNFLSGTLPQSFTSPTLQKLDLGSNTIGGHIGPEFVTSQVCRELSLSQNDLHGTIPNSIVQLVPTLDVLDLSHNAFTGTIPPTIGDLVMLQYVHLNNNLLTGEIPTFETSGLDSTTSTIAIGGKFLEELWLDDNDLSGTIPVQLSELPKLKYLFLGDNKLTGEIPSDLCRWSLNSHFFRNVDPGRDVNRCDAIACPADHAALNDIYPCQPCMNPHFNPYIGQTNRGCVKINNQRGILKKFHESTSQDGLWVPDDDRFDDDDEHNNDVNDDDADDDRIIPQRDNSWTNDEIFICNFTGVTCDENFNVVEIHLKNRGLTGTIPPEIGYLQYLRVLDVSDNDLSGLLPSDLRWAPLRRLDVSGNKIGGSVPSKLCQKTNLNRDGGGELDDYDCSRVACPVGMWSPSGRTDASRGEYCKPCYHTIPPVLGFKGCARRGMSSAAFGLIVSVCTLAAAIGVFHFIRHQRQRALEGQEDLEKEALKNTMDEAMSEYISNAGLQSFSKAKSPSARFHQTSRQIVTKIREGPRNHQYEYDRVGTPSGTSSSTDIVPSSYGPTLVSNIREPPIYLENRPSSPKNTTISRRDQDEKSVASVMSNKSKSETSVMSSKSAGSNKSSTSSNGGKGDVWLDVPTI